MVKLINTRILIQIKDLKIHGLPYSHHNGIPLPGFGTMEYSDHGIP
jgi:hypothetical protein